ncbi:hypothetical protein NA95_004353 [Salmonella enterica subsp. enterica]|nr:hypothetical protein [Salmonella enterica subsp. enterica]
MTRRLFFFITGAERDRTADIIHDVHARAPTDITTEALQRIGELKRIPVSIVMFKKPKRLSGFSQKARDQVCPLTDGAS